MRTIAFIPVRGGSKSIPKKNIKNIAGHPLLYWVTKVAQSHTVIDEIVVATDSEEISFIADSFNFSKLSVYCRSKQNATDSSSAESVMLEYLEYRKDLMDSYVFILMQATSPFTEYEDIEGALDLYKEKKFSSIVTCSRQKRFLWNKNGEPINYDYKNRPRRQKFEGFLVENGALYINSIGNIKKDKNRLSEPIGIWEMASWKEKELDEPEDWVVAEKLLIDKIIKPKNKKNSIKLFLSDVDGVLTDGGMYYNQEMDELKKFNTRDGKGFSLLKENGIYTGIITSEDTNIVKRRAEKLGVDYLYQGVSSKIEIVEEICMECNITLNEVAYIGDDLNDIDVLAVVGLAACPSDAVEEVKVIPGIRILTKNGGQGVVREFIDSFLQ